MLLILIKVLRSLREEVRPRDKACKTTSDSTRCRMRLDLTLRFLVHHFKVAITALNSSPFICSWFPFHCHPAISFQFHKPEGILARSRWNLTFCSEELCNNKSSPFIEATPMSFWTNIPWGSCCGCWRVGFKGGRRSKVAKRLLHPGVRESTTSWGERGGQRPRGANSWASSQLTTPTCQELPIRVNRVFSKSFPFCKVLGIHILV